MMEFPVEILSALNMIVGAEINEHTFGFSVPFPTRPKDHEVFTLCTRMYYRHYVLCTV